VKTLYLIQCENYPIFQQLQLEEALLRTDSRNFCLMNQGSSKAIVLGISCKPALHVNQALAVKDHIPIIQRFSGGGSVVVDSKTFFATYIFNKEDHPAKPFPEPILQWTGSIYEKALEIKNFSVRENDYVIENTKCGGNAQYIQKNRWLHHTTFLWDYEDENMNYLLHPPKIPTYRKDRSHTDFLCRIKDFHPNREDLPKQIEEELKNHFQIKKISINDVLDTLKIDHRKSTRLIDL